jgi:hypothetical protein
MRKPRQGRVDIESKTEIGNYGKEDVSDNGG